MFGTEIKRLRQAAGLTQAELGEATGLSASAIGMIEQGRRAPSPKAQARLQWALRNPSLRHTLPQNAWEHEIHLALKSAAKR